jgi:hypothetical protein
MPAQEELQGILLLEMKKSFSCEKFLDFFIDQLKSFGFDFKAVVLLLPPSLSLSTSN